MGLGRRAGVTMTLPGEKIGRLIGAPAPATPASTMPAPPAIGTAALSPMLALAGTAAARTKKRGIGSGRAGTLLGASGPAALPTTRPKALLGGTY